MITNQTALIAELENDGQLIFQENNSLSKSGKYYVERDGKYFDYVNARAVNAALANGYVVEDYRSFNQSSGTGDKIYYRLPHQPSRKPVSDKPAKAKANRTLFIETANKMAVCKDSIQIGILGDQLVTIQRNYLAILNGSN